MFCRPFEVWQPLTQPFTPKVSCLLCSWQACLLIFHFLNFQAYFSLRNSSLASRNYSSCLTNQFDNSHRLQTSNVWCQNMSSLPPIRICFFLTLAGMADIKRGRGRGDLGATPKFPLPLLMPATQAPLTSTDRDATDSNLFPTLLVCFPLHGKWGPVRQAMYVLCLYCKNSWLFYVFRTQPYLCPNSTLLYVDICHQYMDQD